MRPMILVFGVFSGACSLLGQNRAVQPKVPLERVRVHILATSYRTMRSSTGEQDAYIATIMFHQRPDEVVRLLDRFREEELPIAPAVLASRQNLTMIIMRDPTCDQTNSEVLASGSGAEVYDESVFERFRQEPNANMPCYRAVHKSIRIAK